MAKKTSESNDPDDVVEPTEELEEETTPEVADDTPVETASDKPKTGVKNGSSRNGKKGATRRPKKSSDELGESLAPDESTVTPPIASKKKLAIILSVVGVVLIATAVTGALILGGKKTANENTTNAVTNTSVDTRVPRRIDGVLDTVDHQNRYPVAMMVENHPDARPQSGLDQANVVYEALAEGGITRFLGIFALTNVINEIGPVRSARPYYVDWARGYNALYGHAGGSPRGLARVTSVGLFDLNQFYSSQYYYRDKTRKVATEHTLYTTSTLLARALIDNKKIPTTGSYDAWTYKADAVSSDRPSSQHITIDFSSFSYKVDYEYDPVTNTYARSLGEKPHVMRNGIALAPKNVVVIRMPRSLEDPKDGHGRLVLNTIGTGAAAFYVDGHEFKGTWKKTSAESGLQLLAADGTPFQLNAGQTFVEVVPPEQTVTVR